MTHLSVYIKLGCACVCVSPLNSSTYIKRGCACVCVSHFASETSKTKPTAGAWNSTEVVIQLLSSAKASSDLLR